MSGTAPDIDDAVEPDDDAMYRWLCWWFDHCNHGVVELGWIDGPNGKLNRFRRFTLDDLAAAARFAAETNARPGRSVYFRPATVKPDTQVTTDADVVQIPGCWVDCDAEDAINRVLAAKVAPSAEVVTGRVPALRAQFAWKLSGDPILIADRSRELNRRAQSLAGSDAAVNNPSTLLRLPGSIAWPHKPGRVVELTEWTTPDGGGATVSLDTLRKELPEIEPEKPSTQASSGNGAETFEHLLNPVQALLDQARAGPVWHDPVLRAVAMMVARGFPDWAILNMAERITWPAFTAAQTREELAVMIAGARRKGFDQAGIDDVMKASTEEGTDLSVLHVNRRPAPPFPLDVFGDRWTEWVRTTAASACCPVDYVAAPLLATAAALIGNARWAEGTPGWSEPPVLWTASVGDSGDGKSPGSDVLFGKIVPELERRMIGDVPERHREWLTTARTAKLKQSQWSTAVAAAQKKGETPPLRPTDLDLGPEPQMPRLRQADVTIEKVAELLALSAPKGLLVVRDELAGFLAGMNPYNDAARPFWLEAYGGRPYTIERIRLAEPLRVPHMTASWFGTIQPERLAELLALPDDGLLARFILFWPDPVPFTLAETAPDITFALNALERLRCLEMFPLDGRLHPILMPLVRPAWLRLTEFARSMQSDQKMTEGLLRSAYGKARGLALRLSLILELLRWAASDTDPFNPDPPGVISAAAFADACRLVNDYVMPMAARTYGDAAADKAERSAAMLARWIARAKPRPTEIHVRTMQREVRLAGLNTANDIHEACKKLVEAGWLAPAPRGHGSAHARVAYPISPTLWEALDARR